MFTENVSLTQYSNYKIGGNARYFFTARTVAEIETALQKAKQEGLSVFVLGGGTNLLLSDAGYDGLVLHIGITGIAEVSPGVVQVGAGVSMKELVQFCIDKELTGMEWAGGLPGTVGGAIWGNAGAFKGEMKDSVSRVESVVFDEKPVLKVRNNKQCAFGYRTSVFKEQSATVREVITNVTFHFEKGSRDVIRGVAEEHIAYRRARQPLEYPNIGSMFKNTDIAKVPAAIVKRFEAKIKTDPFPVLPTAILIDAAGLKGRTLGGAQISEKHPNFIINRSGRATAEEVKGLMEIIKSEVKKQFGVELEQEVIFV